MSAFNQTLLATAKKLVDYCKEGKEVQGLDEYYAPDCISVEALQMSPDKPREIQGVDAIKQKHEWWHNATELHGQKITGPFLFGDNQFSVVFEADMTCKQSGQRSQMQEVGVYTVNDNGQITKEEFFYGADAFEGNG